ncbi:23S rRNA (adenine(2503)-C(2))-methyltransferase RlmN [Bacteroidetes/Chlorobi group bacterium MS-B_bin-24]|jgi:23S rRNA (adenine2503-C2)-methyltransferase|nr:MAG: 23S rRNA (adenine(2503)-C(2))-methyltransferase RlmN [Bacteroidetes/Chlorobi group bacterium MS-B_bin-24]
MLCVKDLSLQEIEAFVKDLGFEPFRAKQIFYGIYANRVENFESITTLPRELKNILSEKFYISSINSAKYEKATDGTIKFLFSLRNGSAVESVFIPWDYGLKERRTLCVSSQVGCALGCAFCATGKLGLERNLSAGEIIDQIFECEKITGERLTNIVFMGMGEPLQNFQNLVKALEILTNDFVKLFSRRNITVSTAGIVPKIYDLAKIEKPVKLAVSLHSVFDDVRQKLMPVARKWSLKEVREAVVEYYRITRIPITYEYILFEGLNDGEEDARRLAKFAKAVPSKVNLIPFHRIDFMPLDDFARSLKPASKEQILKFKSLLNSLGVRAFIRSSSGYEINGACGQLAFANLGNKNEWLKNFVKLQGNSFQKIE